MLSDAKSLAEDLETEACFPPESAVRPRKRKKTFDYEGDDEAHIDPLADYKVSFFNVTLDCAISAVEKRFSQLQEHGAIFGVLYDIASIKEKNTADVLQECTALEKALTHNDFRDVDGQELFEELTGLSRCLPVGTKPLDAVKCICENGMESIFPNAFIALRVLLTLPV